MQGRALPASCFFRMSALSFYRGGSPSPLRTTSANTTLRMGRAITHSGKSMNEQHNP